MERIVVKVYRFANVPIAILGVFVAVRPFFVCVEHHRKKVQRFIAKGLQPVNLCRAFAVRVSIRLFVKHLPSFR